ncbi:MAE_28990/MAE_18760 family HEPN-like nuclease [Mesorhizobium sophorae]|uniref:MAE_28990/MAE_18760 family HEPN-like nuclease n=1 Tax=Mesorhizobium sophorae TaxID=1300294 RepID=UPI000BA47A3B|nr:MAE_28990/MAE_18760 family HEPN-like nuclease [Mesorhizobium sophorae]
MAKLRTLTHLQEALDSEMAWRIREISTFRLASKREGAEQQALIRAGVAMVYAHWEGFIKAASEHYLNFVNHQGHRYRELKTCFVVFGLKNRLALLADSRKSKSSIEALEFVFSEMEKPAKMALGSAINTESNLTSSVFSNIAQSIDIAIDQYETKFKLIDESLVNRRNSIAHGEYLDLKSAQFINLVDEVLMLMRLYKNDLQNAATQASYKRQTAAIDAA